jgi:hypothetical protein
MMNKFTLSATEEQWRQQAESARQEAETLPFGRRREALVREARRLRTATPFARLERSASAYCRYTIPQQPTSRRQTPLPALQ